MRIGCALCVLCLAIALSGCLNMVVGQKVTVTEIVSCEPGEACVIVTNAKLPVFVQVQSGVAVTEAQGVCRCAGFVAMPKSEWRALKAKAFPGVVLASLDIALGGGEITDKRIIVEAGEPVGIATSEPLDVTFLASGRAGTQNCCGMMAVPKTVYDEIQKRAVNAPEKKGVNL